MTRFAITAALVVTAGLGVSACNRPADRPDGRAAVENQRQDAHEQQQEAGRLEQRLDELQREWRDAQAQLEKNAGATTAAVKSEIEEDLKNAREAVKDLRTTTAENWWERHERVMDQTAGDVEEDVRRFARRWSAPAGDEVGTSGAADSWQARRDRLVTRLEKRIDAMERALADVDARGAQQREVEDTRARVRKMKDDIDRLRNASEADWWDITKDRVTEYIDRLDASIDRATQSRS